MAGVQFSGDKLVGVLNRLQIGGLRNLGSGARNLLVLKVSNPSLVPNQTPIQHVLLSHTLTFEQQLSEADHQLPCTVEVKNAWSHDLQSPHTIYILRKDPTLLHLNPVTLKAKLLSD